MLAVFELRSTAHRQNVFVYFLCDMYEKIAEDSLDPFALHLFVFITLISEH